jgi:hypothetical protein
MFDLKQPGTAYEECEDGDDAMNWKGAILAAATTLACTTNSLAAQTDPCLQRTVAVNLRAERGELVSGFAAENLTASMLGRPSRILSVRQSNDAPRVLIAVDASSDMAEGSAVWQLGIEAAQELVRELPPESLIGLVSFSTGMEISIAPASDRSSLEHALTTLLAATPNGKTALWDSLAAASRPSSVIRCLGI